MKLTHTSQTHIQLLGSLVLHVQKQVEELKLEPETLEQTRKISVNVSSLVILALNPIALRRAKIVFRFGLPEYNRVKEQKMKIIVEFANSVDPE